MGGVAGVAAHVERGVAASLLGDVHAGVVAGQAKIFFLLSRHRLEQLVLVIGGVGIVALEAVAYGRGMNLALDLSGILVGVAGEAKRLGSGGRQLYAGDVLSIPDLVAGGATSGDRRVNGLAFRLVLVALDALFGGGVLVQGNGMLRRIEVARA